MKDSRSGLLTLVAVLIVALAAAYVAWQVRALGERVKAVEVRMDLQEERVIRLGRSSTQHAPSTEPLDENRRVSGTQPQPGGLGQE